MKKISLFIACLLAWAINLNAQNYITVDNNEGTQADYNDLQLAVDGATAGDYIFVAGSPNSYGDVSITKQLTIIGAGFDIDPAHGVEQKSIINFVWFSPDAANTKITGFQIEKIYGFEFGTYASTDNITLKNNKITNFIFFRSTHGISENWVIVNNIIGKILALSTKTNTISSFLITNNIFSGPIQYLTFSNCTMSNNVHAYNGGHFNSKTFYVNTTNSIFYGGNVSACQNCNFDHVAGVDANGADIDFNAGTNTGSDIIVINGGSIFIDAPNYPYSSLYDYHIAADSPAKNTGTDGTDLGIYGGAAVFPEIPTADGPAILDLDILTPTVLSNQDLKIHIKAGSN